MRQYRCIVSGLNIRTQPDPSDEFKTDQILKRGDIINVAPGRRIDLNGYTWLQHDRGWSAERSLDGRFVFLSDAVQTRDRLWGLNIDPNNPRANPSADRLFGLGWVRFVFHVESRRETLDQAFVFYDPIIKAFNRAGVRVLLILLQDMFWGNAPWDRGDWETYSTDFSARAGLIARHYRGMVSAYQIWNEEDVTGAPTSIPVAPENYAPLLLKSARAIYSNDPGALVITGGVASGVQGGLDYLRAVRTALGGSFPCDGIAVHPYAHIPPIPPDAAPFPGWGSGSLDDLMARFTANFPGMPIWITEVGVPDDRYADPSLWPGISRYMDATINFLRNYYPYACQTVMWFSWSDAMDRAGIVSPDGTPKEPIFSTYFKNMHSDYPSTERPVATPFDGRITLAHIGGEAIPDASLADFAARIDSDFPNVSSLLLKTTVGLSWQASGPGRPGVTNTAELAAWAAAMNRHRINVHAWHEVVGADVLSEVAVIVSLTRTPGVSSVVLDLNPFSLRARSAAEIRNLMITLRKTLAAGYPIGLSFEGRSQAFSGVNLAEWYPFIDTFHPKVFYVDWGGVGQGPAPYLSSLFTAMRPYIKPVIPMFQSAPGDQIRLASRIAPEDYGTPGFSFWKLSSLTEEDRATIRGLYVPWSAGYNPAPMLGTLIVRTGVALRVRAVPLTDGAIISELQPGERIEVLERRIIGSIEWVRHRRGWSLARNNISGEVFLT